MRWVTLGLFVFAMPLCAAAAPLPSNMLEIEQARQVFAQKMPDYKEAVFRDVHPSLGTTCGYVNSINMRTLRKEWQRFAITRGSLWLDDGKDPDSSRLIDSAFNLCAVMLKITGDYRDYGLRSATHPNKLH